MTDRGDEPNIEIGSRSVPLTEWEGEVLVQAASWVLLIRGVELALVSLALAPMFLLLVSGLLGGFDSGCRGPSLWVLLPPSAACAMWNSAGGLLRRQVRARTVATASLLGCLAMGILSRGTYLGLFVTEGWFWSWDAREVVTTSLRVVPDLIAAAALWCGPASRVLTAAGDESPLSPLTSVPSAPRSVRGWVGCGIVALAALSLLFSPLHLARLVP